MKSMRIFVVEDNKDDIMLITEPVQEYKVINDVSVFRNGKLVMDFVFKKGDSDEVASSDTILLDINVPLKNGIELLQTLKSNETTKHIPIIMLTTSFSENDSTKSYNHRATAFITKPVDEPQFLEAILSIEDFWQNIVHLLANKSNVKR
jgi:CheY-like chemotaxis protein